MYDGRPGVAPSRAARVLRACVLAAVAAPLTACAAPCWSRFRAIPPEQPEHDHVATFSVSRFLAADLDRYAALHAQTYGETVDAATLIPHMLEAFMAGDREFRSGTYPKPVPQKPT